jgi:hemerythrin-like domain-containing protein
MSERNSWGFLLMHQAIRKDLDGMVERARDLNAAEAVMRSRFAEWIEFLWMMIEHHHENEDGVMFPTIRRVDPSFDPSRFEAEHQELYAKFASVCERLAALEGAADLGVARAALEEAVVELRAFTADHLDREEEECVARVDELFDPAVVQALEREGARTTPFKIMTKMIPWMMSAASAEDCAAIRKRLPFLFRWLNDLFFQRSFARHATWIA